MYSDQHKFEQIAVTPLTMGHDDFGCTVWDPNANTPAEPGLTPQHSSQVTHHLYVRDTAHKPGGAGTYQEKAYTAKTAPHLAEARLLPLMEDGTVTGVGVARIDGEDRMFIGIAAETDAQAAEYDRLKVDRIRCRIKETLGNIPFHILGQDDDSSPGEGNLDRQIGAPMPKAASLKVGSQTELSSEVDEAGPSTPDPRTNSPAQGAEPSVLAGSTVGCSSRAELNDDRERLIRLEKKLDVLLRASGSEISALPDSARESADRLLWLEARVACLPSKGFVVTATAVVLALIAPMLVFQTKIPTLVTAALISMK